MGDQSMAVGVPTSGRPDAIRTCLDALTQVEESIDELLVFDNSPSTNANVPYEKYNAQVIREEEPVGPGEARKRIAETANTELLLLIDDDTIIQRGAIAAMRNKMDDTEHRLVSGVWKRSGEFDTQVGSIFKWGKVNGDDLLIDVPVDGEALKARGISSITLDSGLPTILVETSIFKEVEFDD